MKLIELIAQKWFYLASACLLCLWATGICYIMQIKRQFAFKPVIPQMSKMIFKYSGLGFLILGSLGFVWALVGTIFEPQIRDFLQEASKPSVQPTSLHSGADR